ncbi:diguanylate cyclase [Oribacterium sp. WCC10]|uniref:diguanylate cyclase n=1 Tax=Oribacterium sp. WCC10 TaxID=1855343 RepID=UPI0008DF01BA|nr:diguanylate cyclase [Oribacterium sp. WCC10]SFG30274.1 diguanylate cyclase (GGDEF) domain-containing protein [Oribacterium sp. WCC10]
MNKPRGPYISIQTKFAVLILACTLFTTTIIGSVGLNASVKLVDSSSVKILNLTASDSANYLNNKMHNMEQFVQRNSRYAAARIDQWQSLKKPLYRRKYLSDMEVALAYMTSYDDSIFSYYFQLDPDISSGVSGFSYFRTANEDDFIKYHTVDFTNYDEESPEVSWFYQAKYAGTDLWIRPHYDENYDNFMISYVKPVYKDGVFIGVMGMDLNFTSIIDYLDSIEPYTGSVAGLVDTKGHVVHHRYLKTGMNLGSVSPETTRITQRIRTENKSEEPVDFQYTGTSYKVIWRTLENNMKLVITAPSDSINAEKSAFITRMISASIMITLAFFLLTMVMVQHIINPIKKLRAFASGISEGKLDLQMTPESNDEIGDLTASVSKNAKELKQYIEQVKVLAYRDALTGAKSKIAYQEYVNNASIMMKSRTKPFSIIVFDINNLKKVNDLYGHTLGDRYIINCCYCFRKNFIHSPFFRIGGDEFVVFLYDTNDYDERYAILENIEQEMFAKDDPDNPIENRISAAYGIADFDPETSPMNMTFDELFDIADERMYEKKRAMKGEL